LKILSFVTKSTITEFALYVDEVETTSEVVEHSQAELNKFPTPADQGAFRFRAMMKLIDYLDINIDDVDVVVTQAGLEALPGGIYLINKELAAIMLESKFDENVLRSGVFVAIHLADYINGKNVNECIPLLVEPATDNEIVAEATLSGLKGSPRIPVFHAFSHRAAATVIAWNLNKGQNSVRAVVAHLGTEISVGAFDMGRIVDCNSPLDGEGPFSPTTAGTLPTEALLELCYSGKYDMDEMTNLLLESGGLAAHLGDGRLQSVKEAYLRGDEKTVSLVDAMAFKVAREIGARSVAIYGRVDAIVLTGPWALFKNFADKIISWVDWIAPATVYVWGSELYLLMTAAARTYEGAVKIDLYGQDKMPNPS
jgi:butyrate kinase